MLSVLPLEEIIERYLSGEERRMRQEWVAAPKTPQCEKLSALFVTGATVRYVGMTEDDPIWGDVVTEITDIQWVPEAERMLQAIEKAGIDRLTWARTGGPYMAGFRNKRIRKWRKAKRELLGPAMDFWRLPWWADHGRERCKHLSEVVEAKMLDNIHYLASLTDTEERIEWAIGDRLPTTGTGYRSPLEDRQSFGRNIPVLLPRVELCVQSWCQDERESYDLFPDEGCVMTTTDLFRGTKKGSRDDADVVLWDALSKQEVHSSVREVNTTPLSACSNKKLTPSAWQRALWDQFMPPGWINAQDPRAYLESLKALPATSKWVDTVNVVALNADAGWTSAPPLVQYRGGKLFWTWRKEEAAFGADQIVWRGAFMRADGRLFAAKFSGDPKTMIGYLTEIGWGIRSALEDIHVSIPHEGVTQVGDDISLRLAPADVEAVMASIGPWLRIKGMKDEWQFVLGHYIMHLNPDTVLCLISPRAMKSVTSPQELYDLPMLERGEAVQLKVPESAQMQARELWKLYPHHICYQGPKSEWLNMIEKNYLPAKLAIARTDDVGGGWADAVLGGGQHE